MGGKWRRDGFPCISRWNVVEWQNKGWSILDRQPDIEGWRSDVVDERMSRRRGGEKSLSWEARWLL
jgi:hypothetical protein